MPKYIVEFVTDHAHVVRVGVSARGDRSAEDKARAIFEGDLYDAPEVKSGKAVILHDDFMEIGNAHTATAVLDQVQEFPEPDACVRQVKRDAEVRRFLRQVAALETASEFDERTDDGMSGDDACAVLSAVIERARELLK